MSGNDWGSHMHAPCRQNRLTKNKFHRRHWINGINHQINARQHRLRHPDYNEPQTENGNRIKVHGKTTLTIAIPCLRRNNNFKFYIADVNDNILRLKFLKNKDLNSNCRSFNSNRQLHQFHCNTQQITRTTKSQPSSSFFSDLSEITDTALRKMMEQCSSVIRDADFNTPCTHNTTHRIAVSTQT